MTALATIDPYPEHLMQRGADPKLLRAEVMDVITNAIANHPRSLQKRIGPSEVGHPCARRIGYTLLGVGPFNGFGDVPWLPTIGTAVHAWLEERFIDANPDQSWARWLVELTVSVGDILGVDITGHCDLYDRATATALDWKIVGATQLRKYRAQGPGPQYRSQIHLYGRGLARRGLPVDQVTIAFLPRNGELRDAHIWTEPYDETVAEQALQRATGIATACAALGTDALPHLEAVEAFCARCPFHKPGSTDLAAGCPGVGQAPREPALSLT